MSHQACLLSVLALAFVVGASNGVAAAQQKQAGGQASARKVGAKNPMQDYSVPYLSEEKMGKFLASLKEDRNPFEIMFRQGGQVRGLTEMKDKLEEFNSFAHRYGFKDFEDYGAVWGRITVGQMQLGAVEMIEQMTKSAEEELKKPDLDPEMRKVYQEQVDSSRKSMANVKGQLNDADLALVKKYNEQIEAATKKYRKP